MLQVLPRMLFGYSILQLMAAIAPCHSEFVQERIGAVMVNLLRILEVAVRVLLVFWLLQALSSDVSVR